MTRLDEANARYEVRQRAMARGPTLEVMLQRVEVARAAASNSKPPPEPEPKRHRIYCYEVDPYMRLLHKVFYGFDGA